MAATDPISVVTDAFWTMLEADTDFAAAVKPGNRIKYAIGERFDPREHSLGPDDLPQVTVMFHGIISWTAEHILENTSNSGLMVGLWSIEVRTRPYRIDEFGTVLWATLRALMTWRTHFPGLTWNTENFAKCLRVQRHNTEVQRSKAEQGVTGWRTVVPVEVHMAFSRSAMTP